MRIYLYVFGVCLSIFAAAALLGLVEGEEPGYVYCIVAFLGLIMIGMGEILSNQKIIIEKFNEKK